MRHYIDGIFQTTTKKSISSYKILWLQLRRPPSLTREHPPSELQPVWTPESFTSDTCLTVRSSRASGIFYNLWFLLLTGLFFRAAWSRGFSPSASLYVKEGDWLWNQMHFWDPLKTLAIGELISELKSKRTSCRARLQRHKIIMINMKTKKRLWKANKQNVQVVQGEKGLSWSITCAQAVTTAAHR